MYEVLIVKAELELITTEKGGRKTALLNSYIYRPNHYFKEVEKQYGQKSYWIGQIELNNIVAINPGSKAEVIVKFLNSDFFETFMKVGIEWDIYEIPHLVAKAKVIEIIGKSNSL